jgi:hypothetical protein
MKQNHNIQPEDLANFSQSITLASDTAAAKQLMLDIEFTSDGNVKSTFYVYNRALPTSRPVKTTTNLYCAMIAYNKI